jgi:hypothetical protein
MHVRNSAPGDRASVFRLDYLELGRDGFEERSERVEDAAHAFDVGRSVRVAGLIWCLIGRRPGLRKIDLARLVNYKEPRHRAFANVYEVLV